MKQNNNAKTKMTVETAAARGWKPIERDTMPIQVATDLLCSLDNVSMRMRKAFQDARAVLWCSILERKPREGKLARKYASSSLAQLLKWNRRSNKHRRNLQDRYEMALRMPEGTLQQEMAKQRVTSALDFAAGLVDQCIEGLGTEIETRNRAHTS